MPEPQRGGSTAEAGPDLTACGRAPCIDPDPQPQCPSVDLQHESFILWELRSLNKFSSIEKCKVQFTESLCK